MNSGNMKKEMPDEELLSHKQQGIFYMHFLTDKTAHTTAFDVPVVDHWLERKIAQTANAFAMQDRSAIQEDPNLYSRVLYHLSYSQEG